MATNIDKALYTTPSFIDLEEQQDAPPIEIEIENPEAVTIGMDGLEIMLTPEKETAEDFNANLAEYLSDGDLQLLASELLGDFDDDISSRKDWMQTYVDGLELLGMKIEERMEPWPGACGVYHPMLSEALVKFQSETMMSTFPANGPVKTKIVGKEVSIFIPAEDIVVPYGASNIETSPRVTHVMRKTENELRRLQVAGFYRDVDLGEPVNTLDEVEKKIAEKMGFRATSDDRFKLLEMQVDLDLPGHENEDGIKLPYIVTLEKSTQTVLAVRRNWEENDRTYAKRQHIVHYGYIPGFGFYCFGLIHLIGAYAKSGTSILRQLVDAGTLSNLPGGFKSKGMRVKGDDTPIAPGEWRDVDVPSGAIRDNLLPLPYKEPSQVLALLMDKIIEEGRRFANTADLQISDMSSQAPVGTTLAILERTLKTMSAVQARIHYSMKQELKLLKHIIAAYTPEDYSYEPDVGSRRAKKSDYDNIDVIPVSDPNASTMAQKIVQYQAVFQLAQAAPQLYNMPLLHRQMLDVLGIKNAEKLVPMDEDQKPTDPVTENQNVLMLKPVKAFMYQDHQAHIMVHMSAMQDPKILQLLQNNPMAPQLQAAMMAHINEHLGFEYRKQIEQQLGQALPPQKDEAGEDMNMDPRVEAQLAPMLAQAAQRLLQQNQAEVQQQQAQQQAQDPLVQMQMQELQIKAQDQQRKAAKDQVDAQLKAAQMQIERERIMAQMQLDDKKLQIDAAKAATSATNDRQQLMSKLSVDVLKHLDKQRQPSKKEA